LDAAGIRGRSPSAVSTSFCWPVKNGWQLEQISTWISGTVERVAMTCPHEQTMRAAMYFG